MQTQEDVLRIISKVTAQAQADESFKAAYLSNPNSVLRQAGLDIPPNVTFKVQAVNSLNADYQINSDGIVYLVLPEIEEVVQDESLATAAAASCHTTNSTVGTSMTVMSCSSPVTTCVSTTTTASTNSCT